MFTLVNPLFWLRWDWVHFLFTLICNTIFLSRDHYYTRMDWLDSQHVLVYWANRPQNKTYTYLYNTESKSSQKVRRLKTQHNRICNSVNFVIAVTYTHIIILYKSFLQEMSQGDFQLSFWWIHLKKRPHRMLFFEWIWWCFLPRWLSGNALLFMTCRTWNSLSPVDGVTS